MQTRAAVAWKAGAPLSIETVELEGPRAGEGAGGDPRPTGVCHTDEFTLSGRGSGGPVPGHPGSRSAGVVLEVGAGVTSVKPGDHVIPALHARMPPM